MHLNEITPNCNNIMMTLYQSEEDEVAHDLTLARHFCPRMPKSFVSETTMGMLIARLSSVRIEVSAQQMRDEDGSKLSGLRGNYSIIPLVRPVRIDVARGRGAFAQLY